MSYGVKIAAAVLCVVWGGCASNRPAVHDSHPQGAFFAEIRLTAGAFSGVETKRTVFAFYIEDDDGIAGPRLTGYRYQRGELVDVFGGGSDSADTVKDLRSVGLRPFDFAGEVKALAARLEADAKARGEVFIPPFVLDGAEYEIVVATPSGTFRLKEWNPGFAIDYYAPHSPDIAKLKAVVDILARYCGRLEFGI